VLFGGDVVKPPSMGSTGDTWVLSQGCWTQVTPQHAPTARSNAVIAFDAVHNVVVLFGGEEDVAGTSPIFKNETWTWDGSDWSESQPTTSPNLVVPVGAFDSARGQLVVFGTPPTGPPAQTWAWNGSAWSLLHPQSSPPARTDASIVYDATSQKLVLFGGYNSGLGTLSDTWTWDGANWTAEKPATSPPARTDAALCGGTAVILFGGSGPSTAASDTWMWNGNNWSQIVPTSSPPARRNASCSSDGTKALLFGGQGSDGNPLNDVWSFSNVTWNKAA